MNVIAEENGRLVNESDTDIRELAQQTENLSQLIEELKAEAE